MTPKPPPVRPQVELGSVLEFGDRWPTVTGFCRRAALVVASLYVMTWSWGAFLALVWLWVFIGVPMLLKSRQRAAQRREHARLLGDCHLQHDALMLGGEQDAFAFFGRFQPAGIDGKIDWCAPQQAFPKTSRVQTWVDPGTDDVAGRKLLA